MVIGEKYAEALSEMSIEVVKTCREMSINDWKLHMRMADYTILDMYEFSIISALRVVKACSTSELKRVLVERM